MPRLAGPKAGRCCSLRARRLVSPDLAPRPAKSRTAGLREAGGLTIQVQSFLTTYEPLGFWREHMSISSVDSSWASSGYDTSASSSTSPLNSVSAQAKNETLQEVLSGSSPSSSGPSGDPSDAASGASAMNQSVLDMLL